MQKFETVPEVMASYPERFKPEAAMGTQAAVQLHLTGEGGGDYHLLIDNGTLDVQEGTHPDPTVTATADAQDWIALNNGETDPMQLLMQGKVKFSGSITMAMKFRSMFETAA